MVALFGLAGQFADLASARGTTLLDEAVRNQEIPEDLPRSSSWNSQAVRLTTAHRAKGQCWSWVVVAGVNDGVWPPEPRPPSLVSLEGLDPELDSGGGGQDLGAERRLLHAACLSASQRLFVTAVDGDDQIPSSFFHLIDAPLETPAAIGQAPAWTPASLVGELRRTAADDQAAPGLRQAAVERLAELADDRLFRGADPALWWSVGPGPCTSAAGGPANAGAPAGLVTPDETRHRSGPALEGQAGSDAGGLTGPGDRLSPRAPEAGPRLSEAGGGPIVVHASQAETLLTCPRQWFLARRARAERPPTPAASVGSIIHSIVQDPSANLEEMTARLAERWEEVRFPAAWMSRPQFDQARAALERYDAYRRAKDRQVVGSELTVRVGPVDPGGEPDEPGQPGQPGQLGDPGVSGATTGPLIVQGRLDRLEADRDQRLWVVDFKTGRTAPTKAGAAANIQLGLYQLAGTLGAFGPGAVIAGAELVYLRLPDGAGSSLPKVFVQESIQTTAHLSQEVALPVADWPVAAAVGDQWRYPTWVHHRLAMAGAILGQDSYPGVRGPGCRACAFRHGCGAADPAGGGR